MKTVFPTLVVAAVVVLMYMPYLQSAIRAIEPIWAPILPLVF